MREVVVRTELGGAAQGLGGRLLRQIEQMTPEALRGLRSPYVEVRCSHLHIQNPANAEHLFGFLHALCQSGWIDESTAFQPRTVRAFNF
jgi:hypothetical protein